MIDLGQIFHYIADYFTFPHNSNYSGSLKDHCIYEKYLKFRLRSYIRERACVLCAEEGEQLYSVEDILSKYGMTLSAIYSLVSKIGIPKRKEGPKVYYSKYHFDVAKGAKSAEDVAFISVADAMEKYSLTRDQLYHYVKTYKITKLRCGKYVKLNAKELAELFNPKIEL